VAYESAAMFATALRALNWIKHLINTRADSSRQLRFQVLIALPDVQGPKEWRLAATGRRRRSGKPSIDAVIPHACAPGPLRADSPGEKKVSNRGDPIATPATLIYVRVHPAGLRHLQEEEARCHNRSALSQT